VLVIGAKPIGCLVASPVRQPHFEIHSAQPSLDAFSANAAIIFNLNSPCLIPNRALPELNMSSIFGKPAGGLFGASTTTPAAGASTLGGGSLFGSTATQPPAGGSVFGSTAASNTATGGGLFGSLSASRPQPAGSLFGASAAQQPQQPAASGLTLGGLGGGLGGLGASTATRPSLFGAAPAAQMQTPAVGLNTSTANPLNLSNFLPPHNPAPQSQQSQPTGAYFDSLFAKSKKQAEGETALEDLPSLHLGVGDLRQRLKKLGGKGQDRPLDGRAHYLLAASGVDPVSAAKDLGSLDFQTGRPDRSTYGLASAEIDVETYLANLQAKTTLSMISDGLERSVRDFDNFLEDNVTMEWDAQRKRIYQHFGIKPRDDAISGGTTTPAKEAHGGFGRSRRSKAQPSGAGSRGAKASMLGKSNMQRSVIGTPSRIGAHQSDFADVDRSADTANSLNGGISRDGRVLREKQAKLAEKVRSLNASRLLKRPFAILTEFAEVEKKSPDTHAAHVVESYHAVREIVGENPEAETTINDATAKERQYARMYLDENPNSANSLAMRKKILTGANSFLEKQFLQEVEALISRYPHEANLGGRPDIVSKIKAYIRLRSARKDLVPDNTDLQQVQGEYVWAIIFYLIRSGHVREAAKYVNDNANHFRSIDRTFSTYLNGYASSEDRRLKRTLHDRCNGEYMQRVRNAPENSIDPFRMACYKIIGRCDLNNRSLDGLNTDITDWIWLQFNLAREAEKATEIASESYGLHELQSSIKEIGVKHFPKSGSEDPNGSFGMYFYLLTLSGMFEDAIAYLYGFSYVDALHFALALEYYGLLRPADVFSGSNDLRSLNTKDMPQINFGRMIGYYTQDFRAADVASAVDYLALMCLNMDMPGEAGKRHAGQCYEGLRDLVLESREFSKLIGDIRPDGHRIRGLIEERGPLIGLTDEDDFINTVTIQAASFADESGRTTDSVLLYHLAGDYDTVVSIVSRALSEAVALDIGEDAMKLMPVKPRVAGQAAGGEPAGSSLSLTAIDDPVELARTMMGMYERDAMFHRKIQDQNKIACRVLLEMSVIKSLVEAGQWAQCLDVSEPYPCHSGTPTSSLPEPRLKGIAY
jgi:nuclear pore complex protein Nup93